MYFLQQALRGWHLFHITKHIDPQFLDRVLYLISLPIQKVLVDVILQSMQAKLINNLLSIVSRTSVALDGSMIYNLGCCIDAQHSKTRNMLCRETYLGGKNRSHLIKNSLLGAYCNTILLH